MPAFLFIWSGQLVSLTGSGLTSFALGVWVYQQTGSVTQFALFSLITTLPAHLLGWLAGVFIDRWGHRTVILLSDSGSAACTLVIAALLFTGHLELHHLYMVNAVKSIFEAFHWPAYTSMSTFLVSKRHYGRTSGLVNLGEAVAQIMSPMLAGILILTINIQGVILIDFATFVVGIITLASVRIPRAAATPHADKPSFMREAAFGWKYIMARSGLLALLIFLAVCNFVRGTVTVLATPLILSFATPKELGTVMSSVGIGLLMGGLLMSAWGGPKHCVRGVLGFKTMAGLSIIIAGLRPSVLVIAAAATVYFFFQPLSNGSSQVIWQRKVAPDLQGRVFAIRRTIMHSTFPLAYLIAGPLVEKVFDPLMAVGGPLAGTVGTIIGVGPGRGIALLFIVLGGLICVAVVAAYSYPRLRLVEKELPDAILTEAPPSPDSPLPISKPVEPSLNSGGA